MRIRRLKMKDATYMHEWMHDTEIVKDMHSDFLSKTLDDCKQFIATSARKKENVHLAIVNDEDEYMGTISLKNIDLRYKNAEFGIAVRKKAMGASYSWYGMISILKYAFEKLKLSCVYWCVSKNNSRAIRFYEKHGFLTILKLPSSIMNRYNTNNLSWYLISSDEYFAKKSRRTILDCVITDIRTIDSSNCGKLSFFEGEKDLPFSVKRFYYISNVREGTSRGFHAHKQLKQLLFCPYGEIIIVLDDGKRREEILLNNPSIGLIIEKTIWREMIWVKTNSVLCVAASDYYSEEDYIRNYDEFKKYMETRIC